GTGTQAARRGGTALLAGPERGGGRRRAELLGRHGEEPGLARARRAAAEPGTGRTRGRGPAMTDNLRDRLDDMLAMLAPSPAPAAAAIVPSAVHVGASPAPATTYRGPQYSVTEQLPGPHSPKGEIAQGTINGKSWRYMAYEPGTVSLGGTRQSGLCLQGVGPAL